MAVGLFFPGVPGSGFLCSVVTSPVFRNKSSHSSGAYEKLLSNVLNILASVKVAPSYPPSEITRICLRHGTVAIHPTSSNWLYYKECSRNLNFEYKMTNYDTHLSHAAWSSADFKSQSGQVTSKPLYVKMAALWGSLTLLSFHLFCLHLRRHLTKWEVFQNMSS